MNNYDFLDDLAFISDEEKDYMRKWFADSRVYFLKKIKMTEEEYDTLCVPYRLECERMAEIMKENGGRQNELDIALKSNTAEIKYSAGGETLYRGFFCPSLIEDIVVGNCNRGRMCKADNPRATGTHYFDNHKKHIGTAQNGPKEYISYCGNKSLGLQYCGGELLEIAECEYDDAGRILTYIRALCDAHNNSVTEYNKETYTYTEGKMIVEWSRYNPPVSLLSVNKYVFAVENGYLTEYVVEISDLEDISGEPLEGRTYKVKRKRKI